MTEILLDPARPVEFRPRPGGPTYLLRVPRLIDREEYDRAVRQRRARKWFFWDFQAGIVRAIEKLRDEGGYEAPFADWLAELEAYQVRVREAAARRDELDTAETRSELGEALTAPPVVQTIVELARDVDEDVAAMRADNDLFDLISGTVAARQFLVGWEGGGLGPFGRNPRGATEAALWQVPEADLVAIGYRVRELLQPRPARLGNSASASSGTPSQDISAAATTPPTGPSEGATAGT